MGSIAKWLHSLVQTGQGFALHELFVNVQIWDAVDSLPMSFVFHEWLLV
jgi:hypothetical protein